MHRLLLTLFAVASVGIGIVATPSPPALAATTQSAINWSGCGGSFQCATMAMPINYQDASLGTLNVALLKLPAKNQSQRIGVLMANPGGPGASAIDFVRVWANLLSSDIRNRFDIVTFDPRGVGQSTPIECHDNIQALVAADPTPDTPGEWTADENISKQFAQACAAKNGKILPYVGTKNVARDMDSIRAALGEDKLTYVGYSYGTVIGSTYADMFPNRVRAFVLDGAVDTTLSFADINRTQMVGFERAYASYLDNCRQTNCSLTKHGDPETVINGVLQQADKAPIPAKSADRPAGPGEALLGIFSALYSKVTWPQLTRAMEDAFNGDGSGLVRLTDQYLERNGDGSYPNLLEANAAVNYVDETCPHDPLAYRQFALDWAKDAPHFGASAASAALTCAYWPAKPDPLTAPKAHGSAPIVVIATTNDPATPYEWGVALSKQLESAVLVTNRGEGHTVYAQGSSCIDSAVNDYLLNLKVPAAGTSCGTGAPPPESAGTPGPTRASGESPTAVPRGTAAPGAPSTGSGTPNARDEVAIGILAAFAITFALAIVLVLAQRRR
jgi:pimeloyl-ACP methyl ester carboxylesterase